MSDTNRAVVIENGSWTMKVGLAGDDEPRAVIPTLAGSSKSADEYVLAVGEKVKANYDDMCAHWVFDNDTCSNWDDMTALWQDAYRGLRAKTSYLHFLKVFRRNKKLCNSSQVFI